MAAGTPDMWTPVRRSMARRSPAPRWRFARCPCMLRPAGAPRCARGSRGRAASSRPPRLWIRHDEVFKLLALIWSGAPRPDVVRQRDRVLALQRQDGGWGQWPGMAPDAFATGQALYALQASGVRPAAAAYQKGAAYLLRTQLEDGTWFVRSRAIGFQRYFDTGFQHGRNQFISAAATAWAAIALAYTVDR